jgi:hypothetical protein
MEQISENLLSLEDTYNFSRDVIPKIKEQEKELEFTQHSQKIFFSKNPSKIVIEDPPKKDFITDDLLSEDLISYEEELSHAIEERKSININVIKENCASIKEKLKSFETLNVDFEKMFVVSDTRYTIDNKNFGILKTLFSNLRNKEYLPRYLSLKNKEKEYSEKIDEHRELDDLQQELICVKETNKYKIQLENYNKYKIYTECVDKLNYVHLSEEKRMIIKTLNELEKHNDWLNQRPSVKETIESLETVIRDKRVKKIFLEKNVKTTLVQIGKFESILEELEKTFVIKNNLKEQNVLLLGENQFYDELIKIIDVNSSTSYPRISVQNVLNLLIDDINKIMQNFIDFKFDIQLDTDSEKSSWKLLFSKNGINIGKEFLSGFQQFVINIAIKISLDKYKFFNSSKIFLIDETIDCVSETNIDKLEVLFNLLKQYYNNILVISHNSNFAELVENRIRIQNSDKYSSIYT